MSDIVFLILDHILFHTEFSFFISKYICEPNQSRKDHNLIGSIKNLKGEAMGYKLTILLLLIIVIAGCTKGNNRKTDRDIEQPVKQPVYFMAGKIEARNKVDVTSSFSARILQITKRVGDHVKQGESLVTLDRKEVQAQLQSVQKNYDNAKLNLDRANSLMDKGFISGQQHEILEFQLKQAKAALDLAKIQVENGIIESPIEGVVSDVKVNVGETPAANSVLLSVVNSSHIYVKAYIPENLLYKVVTGMNVELRISEISDHDYHGVVSVIDPIVDSKSKTAMVNIEATDFDTNVKPGMMVLVGVESKENAK
jgi:HlyD family secretion protein